MFRHDTTSLVDRRATGRWERTSVGDILERVCWSYPDKEAIVGFEGAFSAPEYARLTYRGADALANRVANALANAGLGRGDRVLFLCENSVEAYVAKIGAAKAGAVCAPLNPKSAPDVLRYLVDFVEPRFAFVDAALWPHIASVVSHHPIKGVIIPIGGGNETASWPSFREWIENASDEEPDVEIHADDIWQILPTSGTTSMPKCVMQSHLYAYFAAYTSALTYTRGLRFEADLRMCCVFPTIYHATDQAHTFPVFLCGGALLLGRRPQVEDIAALVTRERATALFGGSSTFLKQLTEYVSDRPGRFDLSSLTSITYTWAPVPPATADTLKDLCGGDVMITGHLGQTEVLSTTRFWPDRWPEIYRASAPRINHVGVPNPLLAAAIRGPDGALLDRGAANVAGEIVYRTPAITAGYYRDGDATKAAFEGGWFRSGDCCCYDENGLIVMIDRYKDVIKSGGENVSTIRVEAVLMSHPSVAKACVVGLPHPVWGEAVTGFAILRGHCTALEPELIEFCRSQLAGFETPKRILFVDSLPETVGGKVQKHILRRQHDGLYSQDDPSGQETS